MTEQDAFLALRRLLDARALRLGVDIRLMNSPGSPAFRARETAVPMVIGLAASLGATALGGTWAGMAVIAAFLVVWFRVLYPQVRGRVFDRTAALALRDARDFAALWARGALSLHAGAEQCQSPRGDWVAFVAARS